MDSIDYLDAFRRRWPVLAIAALIGALVAFFGTSSKPPTVEVSYSATNTLVVSSVNSGFGETFNQVTISQIPFFVQQGTVPTRVRADLGYVASVSASVDPSNNAVLLTSQANNANDAQKIADTYADELVKYLTERQANSRAVRIDTINKRLTTLQTSANALDAQLAADPNNEIVKAQRDAAIRAYGTTYEQFQNLQLLDDGTINLTTLGPSQASQIQGGGFQTPQTRRTRVPIAAVIGLMLGLALVFLLERFDGRIRDRRGAEQAFGAATLAELPVLPRNRRRSELIVAPDRHDHFAEAYRTLRTSATFLAASGGDPGAGPVSHLGVFLVTSASPVEGKTTTAANLAAAFAETGRQVLVVNGDLRRPRVSEFFTTGRPRPGIAFGSILDVDPDQLLVNTDVQGVRILDLSSLAAPAGELARVTRRLIVALQDRFDVVVIDSAPLLVSAEPLEFLPIAGVVILCARIGRSRSDAAKRAGELVQFGGVGKVAVVLHEVKAPGGRRGHYYNYYTAEAKRPARWWRTAHPGTTDAVDTLGREEGEDSHKAWLDVDYRGAAEAEGHERQTG